MAVNFKLKKRRWNGMDLFFVLMAALVIVAVVFVLGNMDKGNKEQSAERINIEYTVEFRQVNNIALGKIREGDTVRDPDNKRNIGTVISVQSAPYSKIAYNSTDGSVYMAENPDFSDLLITIRAEATHSDMGYYVNDARFLVGKPTNIWSQGFAGSGYCISIREID
ncbi:MAG: DUF4330 domain-containing protein [Clostridia bacterium]|nr:DUF4330 domain-containing protein [Clostridia bacterium]